MPITPPLSEDESKTKAEELNNSSLFDVHRWSDYPAVNNAVDALFTELKKDPAFSANLNITKKHIKVIILDLYVKWLTDPEMYSAYYRANNAYPSKKELRYNKLHISKKTPEIVDALVREGYVVSVTGHFDREHKRTSHISRMRATPKLIDLIVKQHKITPEMVELASDTECIILRIKDGEKKKNIPYTDTPETKKWRRNLYAYNNLLRNTLVDIPQIPRGGLVEKPKTSAKKKKPKEVRTTINRSNKFVRRIFSDGSFEDGGRYYGGFWQRVPKKWRERILINGCHTVEIDYSGLHIVMLYAQVGIDYWKEVGRDPYEIPGVEVSERMRKLLKLILLCVLNNKDKATTIKAVRKKTNFDPDEYSWVKEEKVDIAGIIDSFTLLHKPIQEFFYSGIGIKLQRMDSQIAEEVINTLTKKDIPVLAIHDSFIVQTLNEQLLKNTMDLAFKKVTGIDDPKIKMIGVDNSMLDTVQRSSSKAGSEHNQWELVSREYGVNLSEAIDEANLRLRKHDNDLNKLDIYYFDKP